MSLRRPIRTAVAPAICRDSLMPVEPLTASHFARAFNKTIGVAPHKLSFRLEDRGSQEGDARNQGSLADIALICGFGDQGYFTRVYSPGVGGSPGSWRRPMDNRRVSYVGLIISRA